MKIIRIFISSPNDVAEERAKARKVVESLQRAYGSVARLEVVMWEDLVLSVDFSAQQSIAKLLSSDHGVDVAVFILWARLGSPLSEEATPKPGGGAYLSGTEHEFDLMLAAREASGGKKPYIMAYWRQDEKGFIETLKQEAPADYARLLEQKDLARRFIEERFMDEAGRNIRGLHIFAEPVSFAERLSKHLRQVLDELLGVEPQGEQWTDAPYRSLEVFDIKHAPIFFGRDEETCDVLQRLRDQQAARCSFVCIVGASGAGKSSLARAGVAATLLHRSFDEGCKEWRSAILIPGHAQGDLFNALTHSLVNALPALGGGVGGLEKLVECLENQNYEAASILLQAALTDHKSEPGTKRHEVRVLLLLDQLEELWTDSRITPERREAFLHTIEALARSGRISVLATLRSDFYPQAQLSPTFLRMKGTQGHFDLLPPRAAALQQIIIQPAIRAGLQFERNTATGHSLDQLILDDALANPASLPLLEYALSELYERRAAGSRYQPPTARQILRFADYRHIGGVEGAIGRRAAAVFDSLPSSAKAALHQLAPLLVTVTVGDKVYASRQRTPLNSLAVTPDCNELAGKLVVARFLVTDLVGGTPFATLAHEALLRDWKHLADWITANGRLLQMRSTLEHSLTRWVATSKDRSLLLPAGLPLEEACQLAQQAPSMLTAGMREYVEMSTRHHASTAQRTAMRRRIVIVALLFLSLAAVIAGLWAWTKQADEALARRAAEASATRSKQALDALLLERSAAFNSAIQWLTGDGFTAYPGEEISLTENGEDSLEIPVNQGIEYAFLAQPTSDNTDFEFVFSVKDEAGRELASAGSSLSRWFHTTPGLNGIVNIRVKGKKGSGQVRVVVLLRPQQAR